MDEWRWSGDNPIERAAIGVEFAASFTPAVIAEAGDRHRLFKVHLPRRMNQQTMVLQVGQPGSPLPMRMPLMQTSQPVGFVFDRTGPDGRQVEAFNMSGNSAAYSCASYSRWNEVWPKADRVFGEMVPIITTSGNLAIAVTLEYVNKFVWSGKPDTANISSLLVAGPFVCSNVFRLSGLWHLFQGFFRDGEEPLPGSHLENINLTVSDQPDPLEGTQEPKRCLDIVVNHRLAFEAPTSFIPVDQDDHRPKLLGEYATSMHERNKVILRELLVAPTINVIPGLGVSL